MTRPPATLAEFIVPSELQMTAEPEPEALADTPPAPPPTPPVRLFDTTSTYSTLVTFFAAERDCEDTCPITMEPLGAPAIEGAEHDVLFEDAPELNAACLPCGHRFNGVALVHQWMRNHMRCPLCREGADFRLSAANFTGAWAAELARRTREAAKREQLAAMRQEEELLRRLMHESLGVGLASEFSVSPAMHVVIDVFSLGDAPRPPGDDAEPLVVHEMQTVVYFYTAAEDGAPPQALHSETVAMGFREEHLASSPVTTRHLNRALACFRPSHLRFTAFGIELGGGVRILANSPLLAIDALAHGSPAAVCDPDSGGVFRVHGTPGEVPGIGSLCLELPPRVRLIQLA
jgi:hypothetical protein